MTRAEAFELSRSRFTNQNLFKHVLAVEAVMRELAEHLHQDQEAWGLAGLLHDLDYEETMKTPERHTVVTMELLKPHAVAEDILHAIRCHNNLAPRESLLDKALYAVDPITGLIVAAVLMHPDKKLASLTSEFVLRRFKEKSFAKGANREQIQTCADLGLSLEEFATIAINGMQKINAELGF